MFVGTIQNVTNIYLNEIWITIIDKLSFFQNRGKTYNQFVIRVAGYVYYVLSHVSIVYCYDTLKKRKYFSWDT